MEAILSVAGVHKTATLGNTNVPILRGIELEVYKGEFLAIMGPSGSGKSTLLGLMAGLDSVTDGTIRLAGHDLSRMNEDALARLRAQKVGIVFQSFHLAATLTALENVALPLELAGLGRRARAMAASMLQAVGLENRQNHYPSQLSGGEQQRVAIARAVVNKPAIVFADEPTGNLDSLNGKAIIELMLEQKNQHGITLVMVTHDSQLANLADRIVYLQDGVLAREEVRVSEHVSG